MGGNPSVSASATITVTASGTTTNEVRITPSTNTSITEGESQTYTSYLYSNGVQQADVFTFTLANANVPVANYIMDTITNNSFKITNVNMYLDYPLLINATSGSYTQQISIVLAGAF
jgi:DNA-binding protein Fis